MDFQFVIPQNSLELLNSDGNKYFVKQIHDALELPELLKNARNGFTESGAAHIFDHFDTYFSVIEHISQKMMVSTIRAFDLLYLSIDKEGRELLELFKQPSIDAVERETHLNLTKMLIYLYVGFIRAIDTVQQNASATDVGAKKGAKRGGDDHLDVHNWEDRRFKAVVQLMNFFQMELEKLWSLCMAEESFVDLICNVCYRTLEHPFVKEKRVSQTIFQILGTAIKRYNHAMTFPVKILHLLCTSDVAVVPATHGMYLLHTEYGIKTIFGTLLKEFVDAVGVAINDALTVKNFSLFLTEIATLDAKMLIPQISALSEEMLNLDSYTLRNCVLQFMGDAVMHDLSSEDLSDEMKEYREEFLEDLHMHLIDTTAQVRSKTLQVWNHMKTENAVPLAWQQKVLESATERLEDRAVLVRKNAVILIKSFLETNPFAANLSVKELEEKYNTEKAKLEAIREKVVASKANEEVVEALWSEIANDVMNAVSEELSQATQQECSTEPPKDYGEVAMEISKLLREKDFGPAVKLVRKIDVVNREARANMEFKDQVGYYAVLLRSYLFVDKDHSEEFNTQERTLTFLEDSLRFAQVINRVVPIVENMLMSKANSDVFEAIDFFTTAYLFGIRDTERGMRRMLALVWSGDKEKREAVTKAYHRVLFQTDQTGRGHTVKVVSNLCTFFEQLNVGQFSATEVLMKEWIDNEDVNSQIIQVLFERMTLKLEGTSNNVSRLSLLLIIMAATVKPSIASANVDLVQSIAYGPRCYEDPRIFADCLALLARHKSNDPAQSQNQHEQGAELIDKALDCYQRLFFHPDTPNFDNITNKTMDFLYQFGETPDMLSEYLLTTLIKKIEEITARNLPADGEAASSQTSVFDGANNLNQVPDYIMIRLIHLVGYIALKEMVFLDVQVYTHMKYWQDVEDEKKKGNASKRKSTNQSMSASASKAMKRLSETNAEQEDDLLDGATAEDTIAEMINEVIEMQLLYDSNALLKKFIPIVMEVLKFPGKYRDERLQQAACLTLIRLMTVSMQFCESNMPFLMNVMMQTKNVRNKCNIIVGLCDLTFRFPNVIQLWTSHIYGTLHEKNDEIRLTAVKVLSHLIQHEMIRVKGQISDLAMCIIDPNEDIRNITQEFFKEIAQKSNILYNVLPDIISRLSGTSVDLQEEQYHVIMKHVMGLIQKDRQVETLVEKLCLRFKVTNEERQWRDVAYCLTQLNYNEKTIKKLIDHVPYFKDKVQVDEVYESFKTIITNTGKLAKPELKVVLQQFSDKLEECLAVKEPGAEGSQSEGADEEARRRGEMPPPKRIPKPRGKPKGKAQARGRDLSDSDSDEEQKGRGGGSRRGRPASNVRSSARKPTKKAFIESSSSDSSDDEAPRRRHR